MQVIDPVCGRHTAVLTSSKVLFKLSDGPEQPEVMILSRHKKFEGAGKKATTKTKVSLRHQLHVCVAACTTFHGSARPWSCLTVRF